MKVAVLISGVFRSFYDKLLPFLNTLPDSFDIYLSFPKSETTDRFYNKKMDINSLLLNPKIKTILLSDDDNYSELNITQREKNTLAQWKRIVTLFSVLPPGYSHIIRCRPDAHIQTSVKDFIHLIESSEENILYIPEGFDIYDLKAVKKEELSYCINDQFAFGSFSVMKEYCSFYNSLINSFSCPLISEKELFSFLQEKLIPVQRFKLNYNLVLSNCFTLAICGDSGSGKSTLSKLIQEILPFDNSLLLETDRYHKWERGDSNYNTFTHLNPEANNLEKMADDAYKLKLGEDIYTIDYDHIAGKFTEPQLIQPSKFVLFCGLHTLYKDSLRSISDLKIYIDTENNVKRNWKIQRDVKERGASIEKVLQTIEKRKTDFETFIEPQKEHADILIQFYKNEEENIFLTVSFKSDSLANKVKEFLTPLCFSVQYDLLEKYTSFSFKSYSSEYLTSLAKQVGYSLDKPLKNSYNGILQYIFILLIWNS
jgi:uridine kinase